ncbi:hypothetical protein JCM8547_001982 [Rhodosporidiobolus lusitaniae]
MSIPTVSMAGLLVGKVATGAMRFTYGAEKVPYAQAFEVIRTAVDAGSNLLNTGSFYGGHETPLANLELLARFFEAHPDYVDKVLLSAKGGLTTSFTPSGDLDFLRKDCVKINEVLKHKKMDYFEIARVPKDVSVEEMVKNLLLLRSEAHFSHISLSEVSASTLRRAVAAAALENVKIAFVEVEYSPFCVDIEKNGVLEAAKELDVPILAYSPLGLGFLGNTWKTIDDLPEGDPRRTYDRFSPSNFAHNVQLAQKLGEIAQKKGVTAAQLSIAWVAAQWEKIIPLPGSTNPSRVAESVAAATIHLTPEELEEIREVIDGFEVKGVRYANNPAIQGMLNG